MIRSRKSSIYINIWGPLPQMIHIVIKCYQNAGFTPGTLVWGHTPLWPWMAPRVTPKLWLHWRRKIEYFNLSSGKKKKKQWIVCIPMHLWNYTFDAVARTWQNRSELTWLVVSTPLKNMKVGWDDETPNIWKTKKNMFQSIPNHQPVLQEWTAVFQKRWAQHGPSALDFSHLKRKKFSRDRLKQTQHAKLTMILTCMRDIVGESCYELLGNPFQT